MRVVIAPDKFKGSLPADGVARAIAVGLGAVVPCSIDLVPMADGGEGTVDAALRAGYTAVRHTVTGPAGDPVEAIFAVYGDTAVVELAAASGLALLPPGHLEPLTATSRGTGELIGAALASGCRRIVLGLGGSACTDGGAGLIAGLGAELLDAEGRRLPDGGAALAKLDRIDLSGLDVRLRDTEVVVALDVDNPLLGGSGAAYIFGPQKGADPQQVGRLDSALAHFTEILGTALGRDLRPVADTPGAGAAGGVGFAALAVLEATARPGLDLVADLVGLADRVRGADLVITGEGSLDRQSLAGKTPVGVARIARAVGVPHVVAACGVSALTELESRSSGFDAVWALSDLEPDTSASMANAEALLTQLGRRIGHWLQAAGPDNAVSAHTTKETR